MVDEQVTKIKNSLHNYIIRKQAQLDRIQQKILANLQLCIQRNHIRLDKSVRTIAMKMQNKVNERQMQVDTLNAQIELNNPSNILRKGYSYTMHNGKPVLDSAKLSEGDTITTVFYNGTAESTITHTDEH